MKPPSEKPLANSGVRRHQHSAALFSAVAGRVSALQHTADDCCRAPDAVIYRDGLGWTVQFACPAFHAPRPVRDRRFAGVCFLFEHGMGTDFETDAAANAGSSVKFQTFAILQIDKFHIFLSLTRTRAAARTCAMQRARFLRPFRFQQRRFAV